MDKRNAFLRGRIKTGQDEIVEYIIVGTAETDPMNGKISNESPVGKALIGKKKGNKVEVHIAGGVIHYQIMKIVK